MTKKVLLSGVFGPFGVDDAFGRKENIMELFHNQVTKAQGLASLRFHHRSFGLYFLAENVQSPVTVLDFPSREQFIAELRRQRYDVVGISFIVPNFVKAKEMARLVRLYQPGAKIVLGGHGASVEGIETMIECDEVVRGEGIRWLRRYLGENENAPIIHPVLPSAEHKHIFGVPTPGVCGLLVPGVGCVNGCRFCCTTHFFDRHYCAFFSTGQQLFDQAVRIGEALQSDEFFVMDENFLKDTKRAHELLACLQKNQKPFKFGVFSSAEAIEAFGVENMARLGVFFVWIGAESKKETYEKNKGRDLKALVASLRAHGICVLVSGILFLEHHTPENIWDDIDFITDLQGDYTQFMMFTPLPGTRLYHQYKEEGRVDESIPFEEWHGQHILNFRHPNFTPAQAERLLVEAFQAEFDRLSSSVYRMADTALRGFVTLRDKAAQEPWFAIRAQQCRERAEELRLLFPTLKRFAHNALEKERAIALETRCNELLGPLGPKKQLLQMGALAIAQATSIGKRLGIADAQPAFVQTRYRWPEPKRRPLALRLVQKLHRLRPLPSASSPSAS